MAISKTKRKPARALARVGDPIIDPQTGDVVDPVGFKGGKPVPQDVTIDPAEYRPIKKRTIKELPGDVNIVNGVSIVFMYTILGLGDREIAEALGSHVDQIEKIRNHSAYGECFQAVLDEFINANANLLSSRIAAYGQKALDTVGKLIVEGKKEEVRLRASIDMLDRAGVRPKDQDQRQQVTKNELRIIVVDGDSNVNLNVSFNEGLEDDQST